MGSWPNAMAEKTGSRYYPWIESVNDPKGNSA